MTKTVTRFDIKDRPATEEEEERTVVRLFEKRKLVGEFDIEDISREDWEEKLAEFIANTKDGKPRATPVKLTAVMDWLSAEDNEDDEEESEGGSVVPEKYRQIYGAAQNCGDQIAVALTDFVTLPRANKKNPDGGLDRAKLRGVAEENGIGEKLADWEDRGLNGGLLRMNTSNVLRGMNRKGLRVVIGNEEWAEDTSNPKHPANIAAAKAERAKARAEKKAK